MKNKKVTYATAAVITAAVVFFGVRLILSAVAETSVTTYMQQFAPGTLHEALPHGVPTGYDWQAKAALKNLQPPDATTTYVNLWGQMYVGQSNVRPANTRVAIASCGLYGLAKSNNSWQALDTSPIIQGGAWREDFTSKGASTLYNQRLEADGSVSVINYDGYNAHFFPKHPLINAGTAYSAFVVACSSRLILADSNLPDDRAQSSYLLSLGADWRKQDYSCPTNALGTPVCQSVGVGKFVKLTNNWQRVVFSTMSATEVSQYPGLPRTFLLNPDATFGSDAPAPSDTGTAPSEPVTSPIAPVTTPEQQPVDPGRHTKPIKPIRPKN